MRSGSPRRPRKCCRSPSSIARQWDRAARARCSSACTSSTRSTNAASCAASSGVRSLRARFRGKVMAEELSLIQYPADFPIKVMGLTRAGFAQAVVEIVRRHAPDFDPSSVEMRPSKKNKYLSLTVTIRATSREQLDSLYRELCDHPMVVMVL